MGDVQLPVFDDQAISQFAFCHAIHSWKEALFNWRQINVILRFLVTGYAVVLARKIVSQLRESIGEDPFVEPAEQFLILEEQFEQAQLIDGFELFDACDEGEVHEAVAVVSHCHLALHCLHAIQKPLLHFAVIHLDLFAFVSQRLSPLCACQRAQPFPILKQCSSVALFFEGLYFAMEFGDFFIFSCQFHL